MKFMGRSKIAKACGEVINILIIHPSGRFHGSGFYLQVFSEYLVGKGNSVLMLAEGECPYSENGVEWERIIFNKGLLSKRLCKKIAMFKPDLVLQVGVRTKPIRAALEVVSKYDVPIVVQCEDDEYEPFLKHTSYASTRILDTFNRGANLTEFWKYLYLYRFIFGLKVLANPNFNRWVEPFLRSVIFRFASACSGIWYPMMERVEGMFGKPVFLFPPLESMEGLKKMAPREGKGDFFYRYGLDIEDYVLFISGTIYDYSPEFKIFLDVLNSLKVNLKLALVIAGRNVAMGEASIREHLNHKIKFVSMNSPGNNDYLLMNKYCDLICVPGFNDSFNKYRMSSRLVKAMYFNKKIFTYKTGFGESLLDTPGVYLTQKDTGDEWLPILERAIKDPISPNYNLILKRFEVSVQGEEIEQRLKELVVSHKKNFLKLMFFKLFCATSFLLNTCVYEPYSRVKNVGG